MAVWEEEAAARLAEALFGNESHSLESGGLAVPVENRRQLVLRLFHFLAFQPRCICVSRPGGSGTDGNVTKSYKCHYEHRGVLGQYKVCAVRHADRPQGIPATGSHFFPGALAIFRSFGGWSSDGVAGDHLPQRTAYSLCPAIVGPEFHSVTDDLHDHEHPNFCGSILLTGTQAGGLFC